MKTKIIAAFPGAGKTRFASAVGGGLSVLDLDSGDYTLGYDENGRARDVNFPSNYLSAIKEHIGSVDILLIGCQPEVLSALRKEEVQFTIAYPKRELKKEYEQRFKQRDDSSSFIGLLSTNWDMFLDFLENQKDCEHIVLGSNQFISDIKMTNPS